MIIWVNFPGCPAQVVPPIPLALKPFQTEQPFPGVSRLSVQTHKGSLHLLHTLASPILIAPHCVKNLRIISQKTIWYSLFRALPICVIVSALVVWFILRRFFTGSRARIQGGQEGWGTSDPAAEERWTKKEGTRLKALKKKTQNHYLHFNVCFTLRPRPYPRKKHQYVPLIHLS